MCYYQNNNLNNPQQILISRNMIEKINYESTKYLKIDFRKHKLQLSIFLLFE